ncbi:hypothetical protein JIN77_10740 [Verrucomicrobiaceae bacterium R5-34]|nr:hypothetical protein [Verrucomicrobiaceae bacterium R5-34]
MLCQSNRIEAIHLDLTMKGAVASGSIFPDPDANGTVRRHEAMPPYQLTISLTATLVHRFSLITLMGRRRFRTNNACLTRAVGRVALPKQPDRSHPPWPHDEGSSGFGVDFPDLDINGAVRRHEAMPPYQLTISLTATLVHRFSLITLMGSRQFRTNNAYLASSVGRVALPKQPDRSHPPWPHDKGVSGFGVDFPNRNVNGAVRRHEAMPPYRMTNSVTGNPSHQAQKNTLEGC